MASTQVLKRRIRSVSSTKQITKAMQLVAASKMRRAQENMKASRPYTEEARTLLARLARHNGASNHPLFRKVKIKTKLYILIASDKGLAGAYNSNVLKYYLSFLAQDKQKDITSSVITVGVKASHFVSRIKDTELIGAYDNLPDKPSGLVLRAIISSAYNQFLEGKFDAVDVIYTDYQSSIIQKPVKLRVLPAGHLDEDEGPEQSDPIYEPSRNEVINKLVYRLVGAQIFQAFLDSRSSEHSMRMVAMKNANDNASGLIEDLTLEMNKARQAAITQELAEISGGVEALNEK